MASNQPLGGHTVHMSDLTQDEKKFYQQRFNDTLTEIKFSQQCVAIHEVCFPKCVPVPGLSLTKEQKQCLEFCAFRLTETVDSTVSQNKRVIS